MDESISRNNSLFNEAEIIANMMSVEPIVSALKSYQLRLRTNNNTEYKLPETIEEFSLDVDKRGCRHCNATMTLIRNETARTELSFVCGRVSIKQFVANVYICSNCKARGITYLKRPEIPFPVVKYSLASPETIAYSMYEKYENRNSFYLQETNWFDRGVLIKSATLANWFMESAKQWLLPLTKALMNSLLTYHSLCTAKTRLKVRKEDSNYFVPEANLWVYQTAEDSKPPIVLFEITASRTGKLPRKFLWKYSGYLHTDGSPEYEQVRDVTICSSWFIIRDIFKEALPTVKKKNAMLTEAEIGYQYCTGFIESEESLANLPPEEKMQQRLRLQLPILDEFFTWIESFTHQRLSKFYKLAVHLLQRKEHFFNYLSNGRCFISNTPAMNSIRPFMMTTKDQWEFAGIISKPESADRISLAVYSIIETVKLNQLDPYYYLTRLLTDFPNLDLKKNPEAIENYLPWSFKESFCNNI